MKKKVAVLFSGGKDSCMSAYLARKEGHDIMCLITIDSENPDSYMFHTPNIKLVKKQADVMNLPIIVKMTKGVKEIELKDLELVIREAKKRYKINGVVSGALASNYQKSRIETICKKLKLKSLTPLWHKNEFSYLNEIIKNKFQVIITAVSAYPLNASWLGREIDAKFIENIHEMCKKYKIHPVGEGGEFETFVLDCPLFEIPLKVIGANFAGEKNSWGLEVELR